MPLRPHLRLQEADLERHLLRKGVGSLTSDRTHCADCGRTPLVGERIHHLPGGGIACELCRHAHEGELRCEVVPGAERGLTVKLRAA